MIVRIVGKNRETKASIVVRTLLQKNRRREDTEGQTVRRYWNWKRGVSSRRKVFKRGTLEARTLRPDN